MQKAARGGPGAAGKDRTDVVDVAVDVGCCVVPAVCEVVGCVPGSATTGPWLLVVVARVGGRDACGGWCVAWCSRPRQGGHGSLTLSPSGEHPVWTRRLLVTDMLPAAPRLHEARGHAPLVHGWEVHTP